MTNEQCIAIMAAILHDGCMGWPEAIENARALFAEVQPIQRTKLAGCMHSFITDNFGESICRHCLRPSDDIWQEYKREYSD